MGLDERTPALRPEDLGIGVLFWRLPDAIIALDTDSGRICLWNPGAEAIFGYTTGEALGRHVDELIIPPGLRAAHRAGLDTYRVTGHGAVIDRDRPVTVPALHKSGQPLIVDLTLGPLDVADRPGRYVLAIVRDATERERAAEERSQLLREQATRAVAAEGEARYRRLFDRVPVGLYRTTAGGQILDANAALVEMLGFPSRETLLAANVGDLVVAEDRARELAMLDRDGVIRGHEIRLRRRDGAIIWALDNARAVSDAAGETVAYEGSLEDVTARKQTEIELRRSRDQLDTVLGAVADGILVQDTAGQIVYANDAAAALVGAESAARLLATPIGEILRQFEILDERRAPFPFEMLPARVALRGEPGRDTIMCYRHLPSGHERWSIVKAAAVRDLIGRPYLAVSVFRDITEQRHAAEAERFLVEASEILASSLDHQATLASVARLAVPRLADWCAVDLLGDDGAIRQLAVAHVDPTRVALARQIAAEYPPLVDDPAGIARVIQTGQSELYPDVTDAMLVAGARDDAHLTLLRAIDVRSTMIVPMIARARILGAITFATEQAGRYGPRDLALARDLARRAAVAVDNALLYRSAHDAIRARDEFLSVAAHELKTPITGIKGTAQLLLRTSRRGPIDPERLARSLERLDVASTRLATLTNDLLDVARIRTGRLPHDPRPIDLAALAAEAVARAGELLDDPTRLRLTAPAARLSVVADPERIDQVLANLIENAIKYSPAGGPVEVTVAEQGEGALLSVRDAGIGLPPGTAERIFEPFGRAPNAQDQHIPGMGLGLYICRNIVDRHGGRIWAESAGEGQGTTLNVWLPRTPTGRATDAASSYAPG